MFLSLKSFLARSDVPYLRLDSSGQHQPDHFIVAHERPERVLKGGRPILFNKEVPYPGSAITGDEAEEEQPPASRRDEVHDAGNADSRAQQVKQPRRRLAVFAQIVRPEVCE